MPSNIEDVPMKAGPIDLGNADEVTSWAAKLEVTEDELRAAIVVVGAMPAAVRYFLQRAHKRPLKKITVQKREQYTKVAANRKRPRSSTRTPDDDKSA